jgi:hypothetical protein
MPSEFFEDSRETAGYFKRLGLVGANIAQLDALTEPQAQG